jgi:alkanesulfonate monooxygenase SsuD/methylene tetrahydromethanopterin reductase-like flavin-dependent oxidoreductase (luciferase family)
VARPLRVGIQLPEVEREVRWPEVAAIARAAEQAEFDSLWLGDHLLYRDGGRPERGPWDAWTVLAGLAVATERVTIGPLVACTAFRRPGLLARTAAAVDELSGGRLAVALGAGWNEAEFRAFGIPFDHRVARFEESFEIVRRLLAGERVTHTGRFHRVENAVLLPPPARRIPLAIGSNGPRMLAIALPHVDAWNTWYDGYGNTPAGFAALNGRIDEAAAAAGRDPAAIGRSACVFVLLDPSAPERPIAESAPPVEGPPERIAAHLHELARAGAGEAILVVSPITERSVDELAAVLSLLDA